MGYFWRRNNITIGKLTPPILDSQEIFKAGSTDKGTVYLLGGEMDVEGRLSSIQDGTINYLFRILQHRIWLIQKIMSYKG